MQPLTFFEIFLRQGFDGSNCAPDLFNSLGKGTRLRKYKLDSSFNELLPEIRNGDAPFVILVDKIVKLSPSDLHAITTFVQLNEKILGLTFDTEAIKKVYAFKHKKNFPLPRLTQKPRSIQMIPSWFCVLNREYLRKNGLLECEYQTLDFFLLELSEHLIKTSKNIFLLTPKHFDIDARMWARDIILMNSRRLASDYNHFIKKSKERKIDVPYQFQIEISGEYVTFPFEAKHASLNNDSSNPTFSVICPAYKSIFFEEMVMSVLSQTWEDWELVVLIDGPPEEENERLISILKKYASDNRIRFYCQENKGTGPTRRRLVQMAKGDFIVTIDDDDMFHHDALKIFAVALKNYPDIHVFRGGAQLFGLVDLYLRPRQRNIVSGISNDIFEATQPFAINRKVLTDLGGFVGDKCFGEAGEDSDLLIKIEKAKLKTYLIDKPMYLRRISTVNQTLSFRPDECMNHIRSLSSRHCPPGWKFSGIRFQKDGPFIKTITSYKHTKGGYEVVAATRFFDYQTLGESSHVLLDLEVTSLCNSTCSFCPREIIKRDNKFIAMELLNILAEQISQEKGSRQVILCGIGEPTLHPELETIVKKLFKAGAKVCMTTNGSLMNVDKFKQLADSGMVEFNFSLNASTAATHRQVMNMENSEDIKKNLSAILDYKKIAYPNIEINVSFVLCNGNQHEVFDFVEEWRSKGVSKIWIHPVNNRAGLLSKDITDVDIPRVQREYTDDDMVIVDVFQHLPEDGNVCKIVQSLDFISVDGDMLTCALDYKRIKPIGNLRTMTLQQMHLKKFLKNKQGEINNICHNCYFLPNILNVDE